MSSRPRPAARAQASTAARSWSRTAHCWPGTAGVAGTRSARSPDRARRARGHARPAPSAQSRAAPRCRRADHRRAFHRPSAAQCRRLVALNLQPESIHRSPVTGLPAAAPAVWRARASSPALRSAPTAAPPTAASRCRPAVASGTDRPPDAWRTDTRRCRPRTTASRGRRSTRHSTYRSQFVVVHYRWHPLHGQRLRVRQRLGKHGQQILHLEVRSDVSWEVPAWMCDASMCATMSIGPPQASLEALYDLRSALVEHFPSPDRGSSDSPDEEESRDDKTTAKTARPRAQAPREPAIGRARIACAYSKVENTEQV
jgi:hypothetical protein